MRIVNIKFRNYLTFRHYRLCVENVRKDQIENMAKLASHFLSPVCIVMLKST